MQCQAFKRTCSNPECGFKYKGHDRGKKVCPNCGTPRPPCKNDAVPGWRWCKFHGGPNPKNDFYGIGVAVTTGKTSQFPLTRLASKYLQMQNDGRILSNRASLEIVRKRIADLIERIDLNQAPDRLQNLHDLWEDYKKESRLGIGMGDEMIAREALDQEFERAYHDYAAWKQMFEAIDLDRKLVESETKVVKELHAVLTAEDAYELTAQLQAAIISAVGAMKEIPEEIKMHFLKRIQYEFTQIVGDRFDGGIGRGSTEDGDAESGELDRE